MWALLLVLATISSSLPWVSSFEPPPNEAATPEALHRRSMLYTGGSYVFEPSTNSTYIKNQLYVERLTPVNVTSQPYPVVFFHGGGLSGNTWLNTPDNRQGWASWFLNKGYTVLLLDITTVGRSRRDSSQPSLDGAPVSVTEEYFTAQQLTLLWPQAQNHTQWPGSGVQGDPTFDAFFASFVSVASNVTEQELAMQVAGCDLLNRTGPSFLLGHSIGSLHPWMIADLCPHLVKGIIGIEADTSPFESFDVGTPIPTRIYGLTDAPITYSPPVLNATMDLTHEINGTDSPVLKAGQQPAQHRCTKQTDPPRQLPNIAQAPFLMVTSEASPHATYDQCLVYYTIAAGINTTWIKLPDVGIHGNGHFMYLEKNNLDIVPLVEDWMQKQISA